MLGRTIAFMFAKTILWVKSVGFFHQSIPGNFGNHTGRRNREAEAITSNQCGLWNGKSRHRQPVDQHMVGLTQSSQRLMHCSMRGPQDIQSINRGHIDDCYTPDDLLSSGQIFVKALALASGEFLGIIQTVHSYGNGENHSSSHDRAG